MAKKPDPTELVEDLKKRLAESEEDLPALMTTRDLIAEIQRLDPTGDMAVAVDGDGGGAVKPVLKIETSVVYVSKHPDDHNWTLLERHTPDYLKKRMRKAGPVVYIW